MNSAMAVELQQCQGELENTRMVANETHRVAQGSAALLEQVSASKPGPTVKESASNTIFKVQFAYGSSRPIVADDASQELIGTARAAMLVLVHGRSGSPNASVANHLGQRRVAAIRNYLIQTGIDPGIIRVTYEPTGAVDNPPGSGQAMSRQVAIEVYRAAMPVVRNAMACAQT